MRVPKPLSPQPRLRPALAPAAVAVALLLAAIDPLSARTATESTIADFAGGAERVFRGRCVEARAETLSIGGGRIAVTRYTFEAVEHLKGPDAPETVVFRQVGTPDGGARDLGRLAGLPVYGRGRELLLFLLPPSSLGLTSPAGAGEAAFTVHGDSVRGVGNGSGSWTLAEIRRIVAEVAP